MSATVTCKYFLVGTCRYGDRCHYGHPARSSSSSSSSPSPPPSKSAHASVDSTSGEAFKFFHGTSWHSAQRIQREGFVESADGCLGRGIYVAREEKARRFAEDSARHGGDVGGLVEVLVHVRKVKYVRSNNTTWRGEGFDACRAEQTSASTNMEWCIKSQRQVKIIRITQVPVPGGEPLDPYQLSVESGWVQDERAAKRKRAAVCGGDGGVGAEPGDEVMLRARLAELDEEAARIETERRMVRASLAAIEHEREEERRHTEARKEADRVEQARRAEQDRINRLHQERLQAREKRGTRSTYLLPTSWHDDVSSGTLQTTMGVCTTAPLRPCTSALGHEPCALLTGPPSFM